MQIEIVYALPEQQDLITLDVDPGCTVGEAIESSGVLDQYFELKGSKGDATELQVGIFSQKCSLDNVLEPGDRIEIYRPLLVDPKERRRQRMTK